MATTKRTATALLADMEALQATLRQQTCPHCRQRTIALVGQSIHCTNRLCNGYFVTLGRSQFTALTAEQLQSYQTGRTNLEALEPAHKDRTAEIERVIAQAAARQAARTGNEKVYG
jgi:hypothetical protein